MMTRLSHHRKTPTGRYVPTQLPCNGDEEKPRSPGSPPRSATNPEVSHVGGLSLPLPQQLALDLDEGKLDLTRFRGHPRSGHARPQEGGPHAEGEGFPREFGAEAVQLYRSSGKSLRELASDLGLGPETLRRWVLQADVDAGRRNGLTTEEREELRRENRILREEREILKRATAFFARDSEPR